MSCGEYEAQIGDYVDGTLAESARASLDAHLATCAACHALMADLTAIRSASLALEPVVPPPHVWRKLSAAIEAEPRPWATLWTMRGAPWWQGLAAAAMTITVVVGLVWTAGRLSPVAEERVARLGGTPPATSVEGEYQLAEQDLTSAIAGLEQIATAERAQLDMETNDVLQANLTVLDGAIGESRAALQKEPENDVAQQSLFEALRSKLTLLQEIVALVNEMRKGNPDGAARIVSGLNQ
jgi:anti-sigma factor RsiW